jgi:hypothetical protein
MQTIATYLRSHKRALAAAGVLLFIGLRLPGVGLPYHQDEFKNVVAAESFRSAGEFFAHPPLMHVWFVTGHAIFGGDHFRFWPLLWSVAMLLLLFNVVRGRAGEKAAWIACGLFTVSFYSIWGSLMADVDGSILAFLFVAALWAYDRFRATMRFGWLGALVAICAAGFLVKLSFILVVCAIGVDMLFDGPCERFSRRLIGALSCGAAFAALSAAGLAFFAWADPYFSVHFMLSHAGAAGGVGSGGRNWGQVAFQGLKAVFYLSPLLFALLALLRRADISKLRPMAIYLSFGFVFYFILFDFSQAALDKYLMFAIVPLSALCAAALARFGESGEGAAGRRAVTVSIIVAIALSALNLLPRLAVPLYPKSEWFGRVIHLHWNVLTPFNGGSGPIGFYISFMFIGLSFIAALAAGISGRFAPRLRAGLLAFIVVSGVSYNLVFSEELFWGGINGSVRQATEQALSFIARSPDVSQVLTFNDTGAYELSKMGKYAGRFYATPQFEEGHNKRFLEFSAAGGRYLVVEFPLLYDGFYKEYFAKCRALFETKSGDVPAHVYSCGK